MESSERELHNYLLGLLSEEERVALEDRYFGDPEMLTELDEAERALIQAYLGKRLSEAERSAFESFYLRSGAARRKVREARTVEEYFRRSRARSSAVGYLAAACVLLACGVAAYLALDLRRTRAELAARRAEPPVMMARSETHRVVPGRMRSGGEQINQVQLDHRSTILRLKLEMEDPGCMQDQCRVLLRFDGRQPPLALPVLNGSGGLTVEIPAAYVPERADCLMEVWKTEAKVESFQFSVSRISSDPATP